jgi:hypothetical protein
MKQQSLELILILATIMIIYQDFCQGERVNGTEYLNECL